MQLTGLLHAFQTSAAYREIIADALMPLRSADASSAAQTLHLNVVRSARPFLLAALAQDWLAPVIYLTGKIKRAYNVAEQLPVWMGYDAPIYRFGEPAASFYERAHWGESATRSRIETLAELVFPSAARSPLIIAAARALMQRTLPVTQFRQHAITLKVGQQMTLDKLLAQWVAIGYEAVSMVVEPGTFSRRGGLVDIFPMASDHAIRIEWFDDQIDTIRCFDTATQRSEAKIDSVTITPAREALPLHTATTADHLAAWFKKLPSESELVPDADALANGVSFPFIEHYLPYLYAQSVSVLDYLPLDALIVIEDYDELRESVLELETSAAKIREEEHRANRLPSEYPLPYVTWDVLEQTLHGRNVVQMSSTGDTDGKLFAPGTRYGGQLKPALTQIRSLTRKGGRAVIVTEQTARLRELWTEQDAYGYVPIITDITEKPLASTVQLVAGTLQEGWTLTLENGETHVITDAELFGWSRPEPRRRKTTRRAKLPEADYADWREGDYVVHVDYGIGRFIGMRQRTIDGNDRQYLVIEYGGNDTVFVPIHQADRLTRYIGVDDQPPALSRLGQQEWSKVRSRAHKAIQDEAEGLLKLYAERAKVVGHAFAPDNHWQSELEANFPYVETEDQLRSIREVKADMERVTPMDRLICGDVGYGKTEVALRAAFKAVMDGKQVVVLVPTTILAQQHYQTFSNRLAAFPVVVELMSRLRSKEDQDKVLPRIASGEVDIIIGTHRILSSDIQLKDLGLVIIDEEQRFGVKQKEHFKQLRTQVDVLTLTATPIPRTLYMSLTGVRDISMIQTPPEERLPVMTHVGTYDTHIIRQAILRELERGGQVFMVHNRIRSLDIIRDQLEELVPEARVISAHGQMNEHQLEAVMSAFGRGEFDILLATSIIENGIDIPNANTLIVDHADWFGLSQLYQLRGRVGRSAQQAYSYFFYHADGKLTEEARARLDTLAENTALGAGFQIAMRDLEIRGAGDILSTRQTGHVAAIGLHLYTQLLSQAIKELKGKATGETPAMPSAIAMSLILDLPIPAYLPEDWIPELALRLQIYRRIANLTTREEVEAMRDELKDRFGSLPKAVEGLLDQIEIKLMAQAAGATAILVRNKVLQIKLPYLVEINRRALQQLLSNYVDDRVEVEVTRVAVEFPLDPDGLWRDALLVILAQLGQRVRFGTGV